MDTRIYLKTKVWMIEKRLYMNYFKAREFLLCKEVMRNSSRIVGGLDHAMIDNDIEKSVCL